MEKILGQLEKRSEQPSSPWASLLVGGSPEAHERFAERIFSLFKSSEHLFNLIFAKTASGSKLVGAEYLGPENLREMLSSAVMMDDFLEETKY